MIASIGTMTVKLPEAMARAFAEAEAAGLRGEVPVGAVVSDGRGEIASDLFSDRVMLCGDVFFDAGQLSQHFARLSRFRFETTNGNAVARGLRRILASTPSQKVAYRELSRTMHDDSRLLASAV